MSTKTKKTTIGNYIEKVNNYDIRMKLTYKPSVKGERNKAKQVKSHEFVLCKCRKVVASGLKTKEEAVAKANSL